jgi:hypothetical protein
MDVIPQRCAELSGSVQRFRLNPGGCEGRFCRLMGCLAQGRWPERGHSYGAAQRLGFQIGVTYIWTMPKDSPRPKQFEWRVVRIKSTPAAIVGYVQAPDAEQAIKTAIERYEISSPIDQARLAAQRVKEIG